ncbi:YozE family protein [Tissierella praeacuta]|nr:YozE family protein [Tissierella praeacuta]
MSNFLDWLSKSRIKNMDTIKGDFARDILRDRNFPNTDDKDEIYQYIKSQLRKHNHPESFSEFTSLYRYYLKVTNNK